MLSKIQFKRTTVAGKRPTTAQLAIGELAINLTDRTIFTSTGTEIIDLGFAKGGNVDGNINVNGQVTATHFNGTFNGLASRANTLNTARTIALTGDATGSVSFNGSSNVNIATTLANSGVVAGAYGSGMRIPTFTVDAKGRITHVVEQNLANASTTQSGFVKLNNTLSSTSTTEALTAAQGKVLQDTKLDLSGGSVTGTITSTAVDYMRIKNTTHNRSVIWRFDGSMLYLLKTADGQPDGTWDDSRPFSWDLRTNALNITGSLNGNANSATTLATPRTIALTGDATGSVSFNGGSNVNIATTLANSGVVAGAYNSVAVDAKGRVTAGLNQIHGLVTATTATGTANQATTNTNTFLNIVASGVGTTSSIGSSTQVTGTNGVTVSSDLAGKLIISQTLVNELNSTSTTNALTAAQGKILQDTKAPTVHTHTMSQITDYDVRYITTEDLNAITKFGIYGQQANVESKAERNYPVPNEAGTLEVLPGTYSIRQRFTTFNSHRTFERSRNNAQTGWNAWTELSNTWGAIRDKPSNLAYTSSNVASATKLQTLRNIAMTGDATWSVSFDGSANASGTLTLANSGVTAGSYNSVTVDAKGRVTAGLTQTHGLVTATSATGRTNTATTNTNTYLNIVASGVGQTASVGSSTQITGTNGISVSSDTAGKLIISRDSNSPTATKLQTACTINGVAFDGTQNITIYDNTKLASNGNADSASRLATAHTISLTGAVTGNVSFDGSRDVSIATTLTNAVVKDYNRTINATAAGQTTNSMDLVGQVVVGADGRITQYFHLKQFRDIWFVIEENAIGIHNQSFWGRVIPLTLWTAMPNKVLSVQAQLMRATSTTLSPMYTSEAIEHEVAWAIRKQGNDKGTVWIDIGRTHGGGSEHIDMFVIVEGY